MRPADHILGALPWIVASFVVAGIVHLTSVLAMPVFAPRDSFARLAAIAPANTNVLLPRAAPRAEILPFLDPAFVIGVCRYDLAQGPIRVTAQLASDNFLSISFHDRRSRVFYAMTDRAAVRGKIDILVGTLAQIEDREGSDTEDEPSQDLRLTAPTPEGYVLIRALADRPSDTASDEARVKAVGCATDKRREP